MINAEKIVIDYLLSKLDTSDTYIASQIPNPRPKKKVITVEANGGDSSYSSTIDETMLAIKCHAPTGTEAYALARSVHDVMPDMADEVDCVVWVKQGVPYNWTEREPRYQLVVNVRIV